MYHNALDFLSSLEDINPVTHPKFFDDWEDDARELWSVQMGDLTPDNLEAALEFRRDMLSASSSREAGEEAEAGQEDNTSWKWLLTTSQVEQRSAEWYAETKNIITASEIAAIWKGPRTRAALVMSKVGTPQEISKMRNGAFRRCDTGPMDWGVRYEPVVKQILEDTLGAKIQDLGRIRHRTMPRVAASPDGLILSSQFPELVGRLVEIKCPPTRVINDTIPFEYWCQMQLQMEVCERPACEFVEVKFKELSEGETPTEGALTGWITLEGNNETMELRYVYSKCLTHEENWVSIEMYQWEVVRLRRVTVPKDPVWFQNSQPDLEAFWKDVEGARAGTWQAPPPRVKKEKVSVPYKIVDIDQNTQSAPSDVRIVSSLPPTLIEYGFCKIEETATAPVSES